MEHKKRSNICPQCRESGTSFEVKKSKLVGWFMCVYQEIFKESLYHFHVGNRAIQQLKVKCNNIGHGCEWIGELQRLDNHLGECLYQLVPCPNECMQGTRRVELLRKDLAGHLQSQCPNHVTQCVHCEEEGKFIDITTTHLEECQKVKIPCTNEGCEKKIPRDELFDHRITPCRYERLHCKYFHIGCTTELLRKDCESHQSNDQLHLHLALETITKMQSGIVNSSTAQNGFTFKMKDFNNHKIKDMIYHSPPFYSKPGGYKLCLRVDANGWQQGHKKSVSVYVYFMRGENDDNLVWPFTGTVCIELLNQLQDDQHRRYELKYPEDKNSTSNNRVTEGDMASGGYGTQHYVSHSELGYHSGLNRQYLKNDCLFFRVTVDAPQPIKPWLTCSN